MKSSDSFYLFQGRSEPLDNDHGAVFVDFLIWDAFERLLAAIYNYTYIINVCIYTYMYINTKYKYNTWYYPLDNQTILEKDTKVSEDSIVI